MNWCPKCQKYVQEYKYSHKDSMEAKHHLKICPNCSLILVDRIVK